MGVTVEKIAKFLVEAGNGEKQDGSASVAKAVKIFCNRVMLRMFSQPSLMSFLSDAQLFASDKKDGSATFELVFHKLPQEVIDPVLRLIAAPRPPELFKFTRHGGERMGIRLSLEPGDFPATQQ